MRYAVVLGLCLIGCGEPETRVSHPRSSVDPAANLEVWSFELEWGHQLTGVSVRFGSAELEADELWSVGVCSITPWSRTVTLDTEWWLDATPEGREALVFHELGHCVLDRMHDDTVDDMGRPVSVMYPEITLVKWAWTVPEYRQAYIDELFGR